MTQLPGVDLSLLTAAQLKRIVHLAILIVVITSTMTACGRSYTTDSPQVDADKEIGNQANTSTRMTKRTKQSAVMESSADGGMQMLIRLLPADSTIWMR